MSELSIGGAPEAVDSAAPTAGQPSGDAPGARPGEATAGGEQEAGGAKSRRGPKAAGTSRPSLPGVWASGDGEEKWVKRSGRDDAGRFTSADDDSDGEEAESEDEAPRRAAPPLPEGVVEPDPGAAKFKFAGKEYASIAEAEQSFKSFQGMFPAMQKQVKELQTERDYGYRSGHAWKEVAEAKDREIAELRSQLGSGGSAGGNRPSSGAAQPVAAHVTGGMPDLNTVLGSVDTDTFEAIAMQGGLPAAGKYLAGEVFRQMLEKVVPALRAEFGNKLQPFESEHQNRQVVETADDVVSRVSNLRTPGGEPAFPELNDPTALGQIGQVWRESGLPLEKALTPSGLMSAIAMYRMVRGIAAPPVAAVSPTPAHAARVASPGPAASLSVDGGIAPPQRNSLSHLTGNAQRMARSLEDTSLYDRTLGFARRAPSRD